MTYAQLDDRFDDHPSHVDYGAEIMGVLACAITFCNRNLTDGKVPRTWLTRRFQRSGMRAASRLIKDGRWAEDASKDFIILDFLDHNPSRAEVTDAKVRHAEAKAKAGHAGGVRSGEVRRLKRRKIEAAASKQNEADPGSKRSPLLSSPLLSVKEEERERVREAPASKQTEEPTVVPEELAEEPPPDRDGQYRAAFCRGLSKGTGRPYVWPDADDRREQGALNQALPVFARAQGKALRGAALLRWIEAWAERFAYSQRDEEPRYRSYKAKSFVTWLNKGPELEARAPEPTEPESPADEERGVPCPPEIRAEFERIAAETTGIFRPAWLVLDDSTLESHLAKGSK